MAENKESGGPPLFDPTLQKQAHGEAGRKQHGHDHAAKDKHETDKADRSGSTPKRG